MHKKPLAHFLLSDCVLVLFTVYSMLHLHAYVDAQEASVVSKKKKRKSCNVAHANHGPALLALPFMTSPHIYTSYSWLLLHTFTPPIHGCYCTHSHLLFTAATPHIHIHRRKTSGTCQTRNQQDRSLLLKKRQKSLCRERRAAKAIQAWIRLLPIGKLT
jgi:hypothetical protein